MYSTVEHQTKLYFAHVEHQASRGIAGTVTKYFKHVFCHKGESLHFWNHSDVTIFVVPVITSFMKYNSYNGFY